jgi:hypothetical protein
MLGMCVLKVDSWLGECRGRKIERQREMGYRNGKMERDRQIRQSEKYSP